MTVLFFATIGLVLLGGLAVLAAGAMGLAPLALGAGFALAGGIALLVQPFLGVASLAVFSQLDAVEKMLFGFLPISYFKLVGASSALAILANSLRLRGQIHALLRNPIIVMALVFFMMAVVSLAGA
ncbi:MAG: hypothetical protein OTI35_11415, partial [Sulfitobacter sp.]|nr:hypothetical protein [Sulfitobacter sp.]